MTMLSFQAGARRHANGVWVNKADALCRGREAVDELAVGAKAARLEGTGGTASGAGRRGAALT